MQIVQLVDFKLTNHSLQNPCYKILHGLIGQLNNYKVNHLHNLETITMGVI